MMAFPITLPQNFSQDGFSETLLDNAIRSNTSWGVNVTRRRYTKAVRQLSGNMVMTKDQFSEFKGFYYANVGEAFSFPDPLTGTSIDVIFSGPYTATSRDQFVNVAFQLETA